MAAPGLGQSGIPEARVGDAVGQQRKPKSTRGQGLEIWWRRDGRCIIRRFPSKVSIKASMQSLQDITTYHTPPFRGGRFCLLPTTVPTTAPNTTNSTTKIIAVKHTAQ